MATTQKTEGRKESTEMQPASGKGQRGEREPQRGAAMTRRQAEPTQALATPMSRMFSPFSAMRRMFDDMERLMGSFGMSLGSPLGGFAPGALWSEPEESGAFGMFMPRIDVARRQDQLIVRADLPGLEQDDIQVSIDDDMLTIEGERRSETKQQDEDVWRTERTYGRFRRTIELPAGADPDSVDARFNNGVLEISVRAPQQSRGRRIEIKSGEAGNGQDRTAQAQGQQPQPGA